MTDQPRGRIHIARHLPRRLPLKGRVMRRRAIAAAAQAALAEDNAAPRQTVARFLAHLEPAAADEPLSLDMMALALGQSSERVRHAVDLLAARGAVERTGETIRIKDRTRLIPKEPAVPFQEAALSDRALRWFATPASELEASLILG